MSESVERSNDATQDQLIIRRDGAPTQTQEYINWTEPESPLENEAERDKQAASPADGDDQRDVVVKAAEPPLVKVDNSKPKVLLMVITKGSEVTVVVSALTSFTIRICQPNDQQESYCATSSFNLRIEMVYHDYQSHFRIHARFDRRPEDINHVNDGYHRIYLRLPREAFSDVFDRFQPKRLTELSELPEHMHNDLSVQKAHAKGFLHTMDLEVKFIHLVSLNNQFATTTPEAEVALQKLRKLDGKQAKIKLLVNLGEIAFCAMRRFKLHLSKESAPLEQYYHQHGGYA